MRLSGRLSGLLLPALLLLVGCEAPTGLDELSPRESLVETHRAILDGIVRGSLDQPLQDVDIVLRIDGSRFPPPTTRTDAAGRFFLVLAIYNGSGAADSVAATVYAFAQPPAYSTNAADHVDVTVGFLPVTRAPPRTTVALQVPVF